LFIIRYLGRAVKLYYKIFHPINTHMNKVNFAQTIIEQSQTYPTKLAYRDGNTDLTYQELSTRIRQVSGGLRSLGLNKGDAVILVMEDTVDWPVTFLACVYLGMVPVTMSVRLPYDLFWRIAEFVEAKLVIVDDDDYVRIRRSCVQRSLVQEQSF